MAKIDLKKELKELYSPPVGRPVLVDVPPLRFIMIDGKGDPGVSQEYKNALDALYSVAYTAKFMLKKGPARIDYGVMPLEGLWWADDMRDFLTMNRESWQWTMMIAQPEWVTAELFEEAVRQASGKKGLPAISLVRLEEYAEGPAAQVMHIGPYAEEGPTIEALHRFIAGAGYKRRGKHHELYFGDPRKSAPEKLRTILRQPVVQVAPPTTHG